MSLKAKRASNDNQNLQAKKQKVNLEPAKVTPAKNNIAAGDNQSANKSGKKRNRANKQLESPKQGGAVNTPKGGNPPFVQKQTVLPPAKGANNVQRKKQKKQKKNGAKIQELEKDEDDDEEEEDDEVSEEDDDDDDDDAAAADDASDDAGDSSDDEAEEDGKNFISIKQNNKGKPQKNAANKADSDDDDDDDDDDEEEDEDDDDDDDDDATSSPSPSKKKKFHKDTKPQNVKDDTKPQNVKDDTHKVFVSGLPTSITEAKLSEIFSDHGNLKSISLPMHEGTGKPKQFAFIQYYNDESVEKALTAKSSVIDGQSINVRKYFTNGPRNGDRKSFGRGGGRGRGGFDRRGGGSDRRGSFRGRDGGRGRGSFRGRGDFNKSPK